MTGAEGRRFTDGAVQAYHALTFHWHDEGKDVTLALRILLRWTGKTGQCDQKFKGSGDSPERMPRITAPQLLGTQVISSFAKPSRAAKAALVLHPFAHGHG